MNKKRGPLDDPQVLRELLTVLNTNTEELAHIFADPLLFCATMLRSPLNPTQPLELRDYQAAPIIDPNPNKLLRIGRRGGKTVTLGADALYHGATRLNERITIISASDNATREIFVKSMARMLSAGAPASFLVSDIRYSPPYTISFHSGSEIMLFTAGVAGRTIRGQCLVRDTLIHMCDGSLCPIQDIKVGDFVVVPDEEGIRCRKVVDVMTFKDSSIWELVLESGVKLAGSFNHPVGTRHGFKVLSALDSEDEIAVLAPTPLLKNPEPVKEPTAAEAAWAGVAQTSVLSASNPTIHVPVLTGRSSLLPKLLRSSVKDQFQASVELVHPKGRRAPHPGCDSILHISEATPNIWQLLTSADFTRGLRPGSPALTSYLRWYLDMRLEAQLGDNVPGITAPIDRGARLSFLVTGEPEAANISLQLSRYGIVPKLGGHKYRKGSVKRTYPLALHLNDPYDRLRYFNLIGSNLNTVPTIIARSLAARYVVPAPLLPSVIQTYDKSYPGGYTAAAHEALKTWNGIQDPSRKVATTIAELLPEGSGILGDPHIRWVRAKQCTAHPEPQTTHDITVEGAHSYVAGSIVSHNSATRLYIDEMDYIPKEAIPSIWMLLSSRENVPCMVSSTPSGNPESLFRRLCTERDLGFKQYHYPAHVSPFFSKAQDLLYKRIFTDVEYKHEVLAEFADIETAVFPSDQVNACRALYTPPQTAEEAADQQVDGNQYYMGVDWNDEGTGVNIVIVEKVNRPITLEKVIETRLPSGEVTSIIQKAEINNVIRLYYSETVRDTQYTQTEATDRIKRLIKKVRLEGINADRGYGHMQAEVLSKWLSDRGRQDILNIFHVIDFSSKLVFDDPVTGDPIKVHVKPFMVRQLQYYLEESRVLMDSDRYDIQSGLPAQLNNYRLKRLSNNGVPVYGPQDKGVGDHELDAFMLAVMIIALEESELYDQAGSFATVDVVQREFADVHPRVDRLTPGSKAGVHLMSKLLGPPNPSAASQRPLFADTKRYHIEGESAKEEPDPPPAIVATTPRRARGLLLGTPIGRRPTRRKF